MTTSLEDYRALIDGLLGWPRSSVLAGHVRGLDEPGPKPYALPDGFAAQLADLTPEQRQAVAGLVQGAHEAGIFAVLAYLSDAILRDGLRLVQRGEALPVEPYGNTLYQDWVARRDGWAWPEAGG